MAKTSQHKFRIFLPFIYLVTYVFFLSILKNGTLEWNSFLDIILEGFSLILDFIKKYVYYIMYINFEDWHHYDLSADGKDHSSFVSLKFKLIYAYNICNSKI